MGRRRLHLKINKGPNAGDSLTVEQGQCRLVGRHLSESETTLMDRQGNRELDSQAAEIISGHLKANTPASLRHTPKGSAKPPASGSLERGPDIVLGDDSISRAHAMVFYDQDTVGVIDLASTNGTFVNRERVTSVLLRGGDIVKIGNSEMTVQLA